MAHFSTPVEREFATPVKRGPAPGVVCACFFGADRCHSCEVAMCPRSARPEDTIDAFTVLPDDVLERIGAACGKDLPAFASVSQTIRSVVRPAMWRQAYEEEFGSPMSMGDAMPPGMWKACLIKEQGRKTALF